MVLGFLLYKYDQNNRQLKEDLKEKDQALEKYRQEEDRTNQKLKILGDSTDVSSILQNKDVGDFIEDWDTSDFKIIDNDTFCPRVKGSNNFQRMYYKKDTPVISNDFKIKFKMVSQQDSKKDYKQRIVIGLKVDNNLFSEYDIPTREGQVINFRSASSSGELLSGGEGKPLSSPIKEDSTINLNFKTQQKIGQEITQILGVDYISSQEQYGDENDNISFDTSLNDPKPETVRSNLYIGSYVGGCIKIVDWSI